jgi:hypothetical protein
MGDILFFALIVAFIGAVAVGMFSGSLVYFNRKKFDGARKFWFDPLVWFSETRAENYITDRGMRYWRMSRTSAFVAFGLTIALVLLFFVTGGPS